jgi:hypothetical protein
VPVHPIWPFLYSAGLGISFLYYMAHASSPGFARRAGQGECNLDGTHLHDSVHFEQPDWLDRQLLREDETGAVLGNARGHRRRAAAFLSCYSVVALSRTLYSPLQ